MLMKNLIIIFFLLISTISFSQELECTVSVNYEGLPANNRGLLSDFGQVVQDYINMTHFTDDWVGPKIRCSINIQFISASSDVDYSAQAVIVSQRPIYKTINFTPMLKVNDNIWSFKYEKGQSLYANRSTFDPLTSFLDYYANIIIGLDYDSYEELGGTQYFSKAFGIVNLGNSSSFPAGWQTTSLSTYSRWNLVSDLLNDKFRPFREAFYNYHYNGLDIFLENKEVALEQIANLVKTLDEMKSKVDLNTVLIKTFFDAKYGELADYLKYTNNPDLFTALKKIDPSHISRYNEALDKMP
jgi:hypothetical protein